MQRVWSGEVGGVTAGAGEETRVLAAAERLAGEAFGHGALRRPPGEALLDELQPVLAPEDVVADHVGRRAEHAAGERGPRVGLAPLRPARLGAEAEDLL